MSISEGNIFADLRYSPIDRELVIEEVVGSDGPGNGEVHTVEAIPGLPGKYGFSPIEMPFKDLDLSNNGISIVEVDDENMPTSGPTMTLVQPPVGSDPGENEFFVDFNNPEPYLNTGRFLFNPTKAGTKYRINYKCIGALNSARNVEKIQKAVISSAFEEMFNQQIAPAFETHGAIQNKFKNLNTKDVSWNGVTVHLNAGVYQIRNLLVQGAVQLRSTDTNSEAIIEVLGSTTFAPGASLEVFKVKLIFLGAVTGDATTPGIIKSPNGANGGAGGSGTSSGGGGGGGGAGGGGGGGGGGGISGGGAGGGGGTASLGGGGGGGGISGASLGSAGVGGSNGITELGGGLSGGNGGNGSGLAGGGGANGGIGAGGGGGGFGLGASSPGGTGGSASEQLWVSAGGAGGAGGADLGSNSGGGGGGGGIWIKILFLSSVSNLIIRTGKGGTGGNGVDDTRRGAGGQSGSVRIFLRKDIVTNLTVDVSAGTSTGNTKRDGTAGDIHVHDIVTGHKTTVWPATWSLTQDRRANLLGFLNESGYHTKHAVNSL